MFVYSLPVLHRQVFGNERVLSDLRCTAAQNQTVVEHQVCKTIYRTNRVIKLRIIRTIFFVITFSQTGQNIGTTRVQDRARAVRQRNGSQGFAQRRTVSVARRSRQSRVAVLRRRRP